MKSQALFINVLLIDQDSSACHKLILVFSDGRATFPVNEFTEMNSLQEVNVFSFLVDPSGREKDLKSLACDNGGMVLL